MGHIVKETSVHSKYFLRYCKNSWKVDQRAAFVSGDARWLPLEHGKDALQHGHKTGLPSPLGHWQCQQRAHHRPKTCLTGVSLQNHRQTHWDSQCGPGSKWCAPTNCSELSGSVDGMQHKRDISDQWSVVSGSSECWDGLEFSCIGFHLVCAKFAQSG